MLKKPLTCPVKSRPISSRTDTVIHYNPLPSRHSLAIWYTSTSLAHCGRSLKKQVAFFGVSFDVPHFGDLCTVSMT